MLKQKNEIKLNMSNSILVSIVCVTHNRCDLLKKCLTSCIQQTYKNIEIIVIDNASADDTYDMVKLNFPNVKFIKMHKNLGFFPVLNIAIANSIGDFIFTIDDDAWFLKYDEIELLLKAFENEPEMAAATCNLVGPSETPITKGDRYISVFTTGFTMLPRRVFTEWVGYYPDVFFRSAGETYVCTTLWNMNKRVKRFQDIKMHHELARKGRSDRDWKFYALRSQLLCSLMRDPILLLPIIFISKFIKSLIEFIRWRHFITWLHVIGSVIFYFPEAIKIRKSISMKTFFLLKRLQKYYITEIKDLV
jgi:glycosyltransferase involved in cell wall biosynthesis